MPTRPCSMLGLCSRSSSLLALVVVAAACGSSANSEADAGWCAWPEELATPGGRVQLGRGTNGFAPFVDGQDFEIQTGLSGGYYVPLTARIFDLNPSGSEPHGPQNPRTKFSLFAEDGSAIPTTYDRCPARLHYVEVGGQLQLSIYLPTFFATAQAGEYFETPIRIRVDVIDVDMKHAFDETWVFATTPRIFRPDAGVVADAGVASDATSQQ